MEKRICRVLEDKEFELVDSFLRTPPVTLRSKVSQARFLSHVKNIAKDLACIQPTIPEKLKKDLCEEVKKRMENLVEGISQLPPAWITQEHLNYLYYLKKISKEYGCEEDGTR